MAAPQQSIGSYRIVSKLGAGGMGEVWRATDPRLQRDVAIKVLPPAFASDPMPMARFTREAQVLASLNHPGIAAIYGVEERALIMELVEGPTLAERIAQGPIPPEEALPLATQIAEALEYAHERGIVHRDLKPANIKFTTDGRIKILDFGLAKAVSADSESSASADAATLTSPATMIGTILGTAAYMSPEQARGKPVDRRADIWAFGVVLYEMLTGQRPFAGDDVTDTLAAVVRAEPDLRPLPASLRDPIARCLRKDPRLRWQAIGDVRIALHDGSVPTAPVAASRRPAWLFAAAVLALGLALGGAGVWLLRPPTAPTPASSFTVSLPPGQSFGFSAHTLAISPDGSRIVYAANHQLYLRPLNSLNAQPIPGSPPDPLDPVFSPDGEWVAFYVAGPPTTLQKLPVAGGAPVTLCTLPARPGVMSWSNGQIVLGEVGAIDAVADTGGALRELVPASGFTAMQPQLLDHGRRLLFALRSPHTLGDDADQIVEQDLSSPASRHIILAHGSDPHLLPGGQLVYVHGGTLYGVPLDLRHFTVAGGSVPLVEGVAETSSGSGQFSVADDGTLVFEPGIYGGASGALQSLVWVDPQGREQPLSAPPRNYKYPRLSPDGKRIALSMNSESSDIWIWDSTRLTLSRLTFGPDLQQYPNWSPDGQFVYYSSGPPGTLAPTSLFRQPANGAGSAQLIAKSAGGIIQSISPDGKLAVVQTGATPGHALALLPLQPSAPLRPLLDDPKFRQHNAAISPDGRWLAYSSDETGSDEVYVRPFPNVNDGRWQVSNSGGDVPAWSPDSRTLFYQHGMIGTHGEIMASRVEPGAAFVASPPTRVLDFGPYFSAVGRTWEVGPDGRFLVIKPIKPDNGPTPEIQSFVVMTRFAQTAATRFHP